MPNKIRYLLVANGTWRGAAVRRQIAALIKDARAKKLVGAADLSDKSGIGPLVANFQKLKALDVIGPLSNLLIWREREHVRSRWSNYKAQLPHKKAAKGSAQKGSLDFTTGFWYSSGLQWAKKLLMYEGAVIYEGEPVGQSIWRVKAFPKGWPLDVMRITNGKLESPYQQLKGQDLPDMLKAGKAAPKPAVNEVMPAAWKPIG